MSLIKKKVDNKQEKTATKKPQNRIQASLEKRQEQKVAKQRKKEEEQKKSLKMGIILLGVALLICVGMYFLGGDEEESNPDEPSVSEATEATTEDQNSDVHITEEEPAPVIGNDINTVGDKVIFGEYEGKKISWWVCESEDGRTLLVSSDKIADKAFNDTVQAEAVDWRISTLRDFLNGDFIKDSFNDSEKQCILQTEVECDGSSTQDSVFILNEAQFRKYSDQTNLHFNDNCWLMDTTSSALYRLEESDIDRSGEIDYGLRVNETRGVRPAIWVDSDLFKDIN